MWLLQSRGSHDSCVGASSLQRFPHCCGSRDGKERERPELRVRGREARRAWRRFRALPIHPREAPRAGWPALSPRPGCLRRASFRSPAFRSLGVLLPPSSSFESEPEVFLLPGARGRGKDKATFRRFTSHFTHSKILFRPVMLGGPTAFWNTEPSLWVFSNEFVHLANVYGAPATYQGLGPVKVLGI